MKVTDEEILEVIRKYMAENGYPPSFRDIGEKTGITSAGSVKYRLNKLREKGLLTYDDKRPRTIRLATR